jgi:carboxymethylenebutenolidase
MATEIKKFTLDQDGVAGYLATPRRATRGPAIFVIHHNHGLTEELRLDAYDFAERGYTVFIPNMYQLIGIPGPILPGQGQDIQKVKSDPEFLRAINRGWDFLLARPEVHPRRVAVLAYCMGARLGVHFVAATPSVRAFAAYYPSIKEEPETKIRPRHALKAVSEIKCPMMVVFGGNDEVVSNDMQLRVWQALLASNPRFEWHFYSYGKHGLAAPASEWHQPDLARRIRPITLDFLARELEAEDYVTAAA